MSALRNTAADMTTRRALKIEDPSRVSRRVDFTAPDGGFGLEGTPKPKIQRDPYPPQKIPYTKRFLSTETRHRNTDSKIGPGRYETRPKTKGKRPNKAKTTETQGPCPGRRGFCISPPTICGPPLYNTTSSVPKAETCVLRPQCNTAPNRAL